MKSSLEGATGAWGEDRLEYEKQLLALTTAGGSKNNPPQLSDVGIEDGAVVGEDAESLNSRGLRAPTKGLLFKLKAIELAKRPGGQVRW